jgi:flagellar assembly protein FliH
VPLEEVQPLTLEELEAIRQEAYNEGFATGEREGFHSTQLKVRQEAEVALAAKLASLEQIMLHLLDPIAEQDTQIEKGLVQLVAHITRQVIGRELRSDSSQVTHVLREALKLLPMGADNIRIHLNPQDFEPRPCASAMKKTGSCWKTRPCCPVAAALKRRTAASMRPWKRVSRRP